MTKRAEEGKEEAERLRLLLATQRDNRQRTAETLDKIVSTIAELRAAGWSWSEIGGCWDPPQTRQAAYQAARRWQRGKP